MKRREEDKAPTPMWELLGHYRINFVFISHFKKKMRISAAAPPPITHKEMQIISMPAFRPWITLHSVA